MPNVTASMQFGVMELGSSPPEERGIPRGNRQFVRAKSVSGRSSDSRRVLSQQKFNGRRPSPSRQLEDARWRS
jgi:hypothetical protein